MAVNDLFPAVKVTVSGTEPEDGLAEKTPLTTEVAGVLDFCVNTKYAPTSAPAMTTVITIAMLANPRFI